MSKGALSFIPLMFFGGFRPVLSPLPCREKNGRVFFGPKVSYTARYQDHPSLNSVTEK